jgi:hypothetical protein
MIPGTTGKSSCRGDVVYLSRRGSCNWVNSISLNDDVKSVTSGIVVTRCWPPLWCRLGALRLLCPNKWLCIRQGSSSKHTCTTGDECHPWCWKQRGQCHEKTTVFVRWAAGLTCPLTLPFAHCHQDLDLGPNCYAPHVALWNGTRGYHCAQMCLCNNQPSKEICPQWIDGQ